MHKGVICARCSAAVAEGCESAMPFITEIMFRARIFCAVTRGNLMFLAWQVLIKGTRSDHFLIEVKCILQVRRRLKTLNTLGQVPSLTTWVASPPNMFRKMCEVPFVGGHYVVRTWGGNHWYLSTTMSMGACQFPHMVLKLCQ